MPAQNDVDLSLRNFAESLKAPEEYSSEGKELCQKVVQLLESKVGYVARKKTGGSIGKRTDVINPDFDIVIHVNEHKPLFEQVLDDFENILMLNGDHLKIDLDSLKTTRFSVQFEFTNGIKVDIVPAANDLTREQVFAIMAKHPNKVHMYSSCLMDDVVEFMKNQSTFTHSMARLGKAWYKTLHLGAYVSGGSTIMELISVAAALKEEKMAEKSELRALEHFIDMIRQLDSLKLMFRKVGDEWTVVPQPEMYAVVGNKDILKRSCFVVEPANPYNDLLYGVSPAVIEKLKKFAGDTRKRLLDLKGSNSIKFEILFEPQPSDLTREFPSGIPPRVLITFQEPFSSINGDQKVRREEGERAMQKTEVKNVVAAMKRNLLMTVNSAASGARIARTIDGLCFAADKMSLNSTAVAGGNANATIHHDVAAAVRNMTRNNFQTELCDARDKSHEHFDVTLSVPYQVDGGSYAVRFSMSWN